MGKETIFTLSELICQVRNPPLEEGTFSGECAFCGKKCLCLPLELKKTFTSSEYIQDTEAICPECNHLYLTPEYRNNMFFCSPKEFRILKRNEVIRKILSNKSFPFVIYTTNTFKKQGFLLLLSDGLNYSKGMIVIGYDMQRLYFSAKEFSDMNKRAKELFALGISKKEILSAYISKRVTQKIDDCRFLIQELQVRKKNAKWEWIVQFTPYPSKEGKKE